MNELEKRKGKGGKTRRGVVFLFSSPGALAGAGLSWPDLTLPRRRCHLETASRVVKETDCLEDWTRAVRYRTASQCTHERTSMVCGYNRMPGGGDLEREKERRKSQGVAQDDVEERAEGRSKVLPRMRIGDSGATKPTELLQTGIERARRSAWQQQLLPSS